ncbi:MAG: hypothetical protein JWL76_2174 [Thermoleophilia bacterium]|nr:hypothetical protein [Thermoleophilia bacterium]
MALFATIAAFATAMSVAVAPAPATGTLPDDPTDRAEGNNPTIAQKMLGYDAWARAHGRQADVLILGSSRSVMLDPQQIRRVTGATAYNAGISSGAARELLAMTSYADLRSGGRLPKLVVLLDLEAFDNRRPTTRVVDYQRRLDAAHTACSEPTDCRRDWLLAARRITVDAIRRQRTAARPYTETQRSDGRQINGMLERMDARGEDLGALRRERIAIRTRSYRPGGFDAIYPAPRAAFERMLELANARGVTPVIAITAMHPDCIRVCGPAGWTARHAEVRELLRTLQEHNDFRVIDLSHPVSWNGSGAHFFDEIHLRPGGAALVVRRLASFRAFD